MFKNKMNVLWGFALLLLLATACSAPTNSGATTTVEAEFVASETAVTDSEMTDSVTETPVEIEAVAVDTAVPHSVAEATEANSATHESTEATEVDNTAVTQITLAGDNIGVDGSGVSVNGRIATITQAGTYQLSGTLSEGQIVVDSGDETAVQLILAGVEISNSSTAPIYVANAGETIILLAENSENIITDGANYIFPDAESDEPNAALFSHDDLTITGTGALIVQANYNDGITSKDGLIINSGTITVVSADDAIRGKDYLLVKDGTLKLTAQGDGLKSDEADDATLGYIAIEGGTITIASGGDAIQAETDVLISDGTFNLTSGGGSNGSLAADASAKGVKAAVSINIDGGTFVIDSADDAIHSNDNLVVNGGSFTIATGDDGLHADATLEINGGVVNVTSSYEGIESAVITINNGEISVVSSDDGINVAGGNDGSGFGPGGGGPRGGRGQDTFVEYDGDYYLYINGGNIIVDASGDGLDANGAIEMSGGTVIVNGPTQEMNAALDYDGNFTMSGGFFVATGSARMAQTSDISSTQNGLLLNFNTALPAGTLVHIEDSSGNELLTFAPAKSFQSIAFSSPELVSGETYTVYYGGSDGGTAVAGLYQNSAYSGGTEYTSFTVSSVVTTIGTVGNR